MDLLPQVLIPLLIIGGFVYLFIRRNRERAGNAPLRGEIEARVCFETTLDRASILGTGGFGGTRGVWIRLSGSARDDERAGASRRWSARGPRAVQAADRSEGRPVGPRPSSVR